MTSRECSPRHILLIEDNPSDVFLLRRALDEYSFAHTMEVVRDGEQALQYIDRIRTGAATAPDLIVLDLNLPRHDGIEVLTECRSIPELAHLPVIVLTSSDSPLERNKAEQLGVSDYIRKPVMLDDFMAVGGRIKSLFEGRSATP